MDKIKIRGGNQLNGKIYISGAKNAALPLVCASLLTKESVTLTNMPMLSDIKSLNSLLSVLGTKIEEKITDKTKAILVVHLYGQASKMDDVLALCKKYNLRLVEDCAQSHGACFDGQMTGTFGDIGCFSFYPSKNIGAFGDGGAIVTNDDKIAEDFRVFRNYGSEKRYYNKVVGANSRLDEMQAGLLRVRLSHVEEIEAERMKIAARYEAELKNPNFKMPKIRQGATSVWHQFVLQCEERERLIDYLNEKVIPVLSNSQKAVVFELSDEIEDVARDYEVKVKHIKNNAFAANVGEKD